MTAQARAMLKSQVEVGSIFQRNDGTWIVKWREIGGPKDWHQHRAEGARERGEAIAHFAKRFPEGPTTWPSFGAWFTGGYLPRLAVGESTRRLYEQHWRIRCGALDPLKFHELTPDRLMGWIAKLSNARVLAGPRRGHTVSPNYCHGVAATVFAALNHAHALGLLAHNPVDAARRVLPRQVGISRKRRALSAVELVQLLTCERIAIARRVMYRTQALALLRPGEARALRWSDIDMDRQVLHVRRTSRSRTEEGPTKSRIDREVPLHPELAPSLEAWRESWRVLYGRRAEPHDYLFPGRDLGRRAPNAQGFADDLRRAELPPLVPHGLRHTGASAYRDAGVTIDDLRELLGHRRNLTEHYARPTPERLARETRKFTLPECAKNKNVALNSAAGVGVPSMPHPSESRGSSGVGDLKTVAQPFTFPDAPDARASILAENTNESTATTEPAPAPDAPVEFVRTETLGRPVALVIRRPAFWPSEPTEPGEPLRLVFDASTSRPALSELLALLVDLGAPAELAPLTTEEERGEHERASFVARLVAFVGIAHEAAIAWRAIDDAELAELEAPPLAKHARALDRLSTGARDFERRTTLAAVAGPSPLDAARAELLDAARALSALRTSFPEHEPTRWIEYGEKLHRANVRLDDAARALDALEKGGAS